MGERSKKVDKAVKGKGISEGVTDDKQRVRHCEHRQFAAIKLK
jgi:hypothetical protein